MAQEAFQSDAFQNDAFQMFSGGGPVWPLPSQVLAGITYGPTGADYTGTLTSTAGENTIAIRSFTGRF